MKATGAIYATTTPAVRAGAVCATVGGCTRKGASRCCIEDYTMCFGDRCSESEKLNALDGEVHNDVYAFSEDLFVGASYVLVERDRQDTS